jgi:hypothetical protein
VQNSGTKLKGGAADEEATSGREGYQGEEGEG